MVLTPLQAGKNKEIGRQSESNLERQCAVCCCEATVRYIELLRVGVTYLQLLAGERTSVSGRPLRRCERSQRPNGGKRPACDFFSIAAGVCKSPVGESGCKAR